MPINLEKSKYEEAVYPLSRMENLAKRTLKRFLIVQAISYVSALIIVLGEFADLPSAILTPFTVASAYLLPGFTLTWAIEGSTLWGMNRIKILVWSLLLSFGLNFGLLFILNFTIGMLIWLIILFELISALVFSTIGYMRERKALLGLPDGIRVEDRCQNCGSPIRPENDFCANCGIYLRGEPEGVSAEDGVI